ncbi:MAG: TonB-dependent receptor plug domain-containing protein [Gemmatimonadaceae bacterium]
MIPTSSRIVLARVALIALFGAVLTVRVSAQSAPGAPPPAGADVIVIVPDSLSSVPRTLSELLRDYVASASVNRSSGGLGASAFVSLRDASAMRGDDPLVVIDGVRQVSYRTTIDTLSRRSPSILDDIMLDDVARVEVLSGPAAAAGYGYDGQRGVIVVTTREPGHGRPTLRASITTSAGDDNADYARNLARVSASGIACPYNYETAGFCTATRTSTYTPLLDRSPFRDAQQARVHLGASGGLAALGYAASLGYERGIGTMDADGADRAVASLRLAMPIAGRVRASLVSSATARGVTLPADGYSSLFAAGLGGGPLDCSPTTPCGNDSVSGGYAGTPLSWLAPRGPHRRIGHLGEALTVDVDATSSLSLRTTVSGDVFRDKAGLRDTVAPGAVPGMSKTTARERNWRVDGGEEARFATRVGGVASTTTVAVRGHFERSHDENATYSVIYPPQFPPGLSSGSWSWSWLFRNRYEASLDQRFAWSDRGTVGFGLMRTKTTGGKDGPHLPVTLDPRIDGAYRVVSPAAPLGALTSLRLRSAWGQASGHDGRLFVDPRILPSILYYPPTGYGGYGTAPVPKYPPDRSAELEGGFDAAFAPAETRLSVTGFRRRETLRHPYVSALATDDVNGAITRKVNGGELRAEATPVSSELARLHLRGQLAVSHDRVSGIKRLPITSPQQLGYTLDIANGASWNSLHTLDYSWSDANANGVIDRDEVLLSNTDPARQRSRPSTIGSLTTDLEIARSITITALLDHVGGYRVVDMTSGYQCMRGVCPALNDRNASLASQAAAVAALMRRSAAGFTVPGDATRLRELSLAWRSARAAAAVQASSLAVTLSAYDLASWTRAKGVHPETDVPPIGVRSMYTWSVVQPIPRTVALRVALTY